MGVLQLGIFPSLIKIVGMVKWSRAGSILCVASLVMVPNVKALSWNFPSLFTACVASNLLVNCSLSAVSYVDHCPSLRATDRRRTVPSR